MLDLGPQKDELTNEERLVELNQQMFDAEAKKKIGEEDWNKFLWRMLANNFQIKRSDPNLLPQNKAEMITFIQQFGNTAERVVSSTETFQRGPYGVVTSTVTLPAGDRFHNLKVFVKGSEPSHPDWQCVYWHVSKIL